MSFQHVVRILSFMAVPLAVLVPVYAKNVDLGSAALSLCDPLMTPRDEERDGDKNARVEKTIRYDLETAVPLASDAEVIATIAEETWDPATGAVKSRAEICPGEPSYVVNWASVMTNDENGVPQVEANGYMALRKDGTFSLTYQKRPYAGKWTLAGGGKVRLEATWLNGGAPLEAPVEKVTTPVEFTQSDGQTSTFNEVVYRVGPFRLMPLETTVKGIEQKCICATK